MQQEAISNLIRVYQKEVANLEAIANAIGVLKKHDVPGISNEQLKMKLDYSNGIVEQAQKEALAELTAANA